MAEYSSATKPVVLATRLTEMDVVETHKLLGSYGEEYYEIDLGQVYGNVHSTNIQYGSSGDRFIKSLLIYLVDLAKTGKINLAKSPLVLTDYGCGRNTAVNVLGHFIGNNPDLGADIRELSIEEILYKYRDRISASAAEIAAQSKGAGLGATETYGNVMVRRYDIGIPEYREFPMPGSSDVTFCLDVFEHIPRCDFRPFYSSLLAVGGVLIANISIRDAVNYCIVGTEGNMVEYNGPIAGYDVVRLTRAMDGKFLMSLHVNIGDETHWKQLLLASGCPSSVFGVSQDFTAVMHFAGGYEPSPEASGAIGASIESGGNVDLITLPTPINSKYQLDPVLFDRVASAQAAKLIFHLNGFSRLRDSEFKERGTAETRLMLEFYGVRPELRNGIYVLPKITPEQMMELKARALLLETEVKLTHAPRILAETADDGERNMELHRLMISFAETHLTPEHEAKLEQYRQAIRSNGGFIPNALGQIESAQQEKAALDRPVGRY